MPKRKSRNTQKTWELLFHHQTTATSFETSRVSIQPRKGPTMRATELSRRCRPWLANKRFEISKFKYVQIQIPESSNLRNNRARSRLYRSQHFQVNTVFILVGITYLFEKKIEKSDMESSRQDLHRTPLHRSLIANFSSKVTIFFVIELMNIQ